MGWPIRYAGISRRYAECDPSPLPFVKSCYCTVDNRSPSVIASLMAELKRRNRLYHLLSHCNQAIVHCQYERELLQTVCDHAVTHGGFKMAWIGWVDDTNQVITPFVAAGSGTENLESIQISLNPDDPFGQGPASEVVNHDRPYWCQDYAADPRTAPWREHYPGRHWGSAAVLPLHRHEQVIGVLILYADERWEFDHDAQALLIELAATLDFALKYLEDQKILRRAAAVFAHTREGILITDAQHNIVATNAAFTQITGYTEEEVLGKNPRFLKSGIHDAAFNRKKWQAVHEIGYWRGEIWNRRKTGELYPQWQTLSSVRDSNGKLIYYVAVFSDLSGIRNAEQKLEYLAHHDPLTGLPNRLLLELRTDHALQRTHKKKSVALLFIDLDRFKHINDSFGHAVGDALLLNVAARLKEHLRSDDTLARLNGDEFAVLIERIKHSRFAANLATTLISAFAEPFIIQEHILHIGVSIGISLSPDDGNNFATLLRNADSAMHQAKTQGRNNYQFYTSALTAAALQRVALENDLRQALKLKQLTVLYQPQLDLHSRQVIGAEALVRWHHPSKGPIPPDQFIPLAEETGFILALGEWVLHTACRQMHQWQQDGLPITRMSVNIAGQQLHRDRGNLMALVPRVLAATRLPPTALDLEITESFIMQQAEHSIATLDQLRTLGVSLSIDDFGTGHSSLAYLKRLPIDTLKIDKSFICNIPSDSNDVAITRAVIALANSLQLKVVAEGIETEQQHQFLLDQGCHFGQGYWYSRPLDAVAFFNYIKKLT